LILSYLSGFLIKYLLFALLVIERVSKKGKFEEIVFYIKYGALETTNNVNLPKAKVKDYAYQIKKKL